MHGIAVEVEKLLSTDWKETEGSILDSTTERVLDFLYPLTGALGFLPVVTSMGR